MINKDIELSIDGMGIAIYSNGVMSGIEEGADFFATNFAQADKMSEHIRKCDITGFCTGSGGDYSLKKREGYPDAETDNNYPVSIRLGLEVKDSKVSFVDIFRLMEWNSDIPEEQQIDLEDGFYHMTVLTRLPGSGYWGGDRTIYIYFQKLDSKPQLT